MPNYYSVSALFEPGAPPPPLPLLAAHTSIGSFSCAPHKLAAHETLPLIMPVPVLSHHPQPTPIHQRLTSPVRRRSATPIASSAPAIEITRLGTPKPLTPPAVWFSMPVADDEDSASKASDTLQLTSLPSGAGSEADSDMYTNTNGGKIPKPTGEAGRPKRGGYNLQTILKWTIKDYKDFKVHIVLPVSTRHACLLINDSHRFRNTFTSR